MFVLEVNTARRGEAGPGAAGWPGKPASEIDKHFLLGKALTFLIKKMLDPVTLATVSLLVVSEALPFLDCCPANGLGHSLYLGLKAFVDTSKAALSTTTKFN
jgi:hypothetical protein